MVNGEETSVSALPEVDPYALLMEWLRWWKEDPEAPVKMPNALHVRTAMALLVHAQAVGGDLALAEMARGVVGEPLGTQEQPPQ